MGDFCVCSSSILVLLLIKLCLLNYCINGEQVSNVNARSSSTSTNGCDLFRGSWVLDDGSSYPLYDTSNCPFIEKEFDCLKNGRPDKDYLKYRWQPSGCVLPRFNGEDLLMKLKGKRVMFVGDSLSLNQWQSLTCMLHVAVPHANYTLDRIGDLSKFTFPWSGSKLRCESGYLSRKIIMERARVIDV
ncbi:hypothetical protein LguiA_022253 [Lonicera macranthoides]